MLWCVVLLGLLVSFAASSVPRQEERNVTWESFLSFGKSFSQRAIRQSLIPLLRSLSQANISSDCEVSLMAFGLALLKAKSWALRMADASGKPSGGMLEGTVMDLGSFDECLKIRVNDTSMSAGKNNEAFRGKYCMVGFKLPLIRPLYEKTSDGKTYEEAYGKPPDWAMEILEKSGGYLKRVAFWLGMCIPSTCAKDDLLKIASRFSAPVGANVMVKDCQIDEPFVWPTYSVVAVCILGCLTALCIIGTLVDVVARWRNSNPSNREDDREITDGRGPNKDVFLRVPKAFSVLANTENLFQGNLGGGSLTCFDGIRFLSASWIILGHSYFYTDPWKYLKYRHLVGFVDVFNRSNLPVAVIENFSIPVGSFFFMSGFLLVYTTWRLLEKSEGKLNLLVFVIRKFWRMTPALGLTLAILFCMQLIDSGPVWNSTLQPTIDQCRNLWWANLLYINNWWDVDQYCMIHTWYLAALMQYHIVGILLLLIVYNWPIIGIIVGSMITVGCSAVVALLVVWNDYPMPAYGLIKDMDVIEDYSSRIYVKSFAHFASYLIGMIVAYIILKYHKKNMDPRYRVIGWILAVLGAVSSVYGLYGPADSVIVRAVYIVGHRIGWALSIGWLIYACATGNGGMVNRLLSWGAMSPLGRLSYLTYLLHPLVIIYRTASMRERVYYGHTELVFSFVSTLVVSIFMAYVGYVSVEAPFGILEKMVFSNRSKVDFKKMEYNKDPQVTACAIKKTLDP